MTMERKSGGVVSSGSITHRLYGTPYIAASTTLQMPWIRVKEAYRKVGGGSFVQSLQIDSTQPQVLTLSKVRFAQSYSGGAEILDPVTYQANTYFRTRWTGTTNQAGKYIRIFLRIFSATDGSQFWTDYGYSATVNNTSNRTFTFTFDDNSGGIGFMEALVIAYPDQGLNVPPDNAVQRGYHLAL